MAAPESDDQLVRRIAAGDEAALRVAYSRHSPAVFGLAVRVIGDRSHAEDVVQDVFVRLWQDPERFDARRGPLRAYLLANAHSRSVERVRKEDSQRRRTERAQQLPDVPPDDDPGLEVAAAGVRAAVRAALSELPFEQRQAIELAYYDGLAYREVAAVLDQPEGTVKYRIRVGMQKMRAALDAANVGVGEPW